MKKFLTLAVMATGAMFMSSDTAEAQRFGRSSGFAISIGSPRGGVSYYRNRGGFSGLSGRSLYRTGPVFVPRRRVVSPYGYGGGYYAPVHSGYGYGYNPYCY